MVDKPRIGAGTRRVAEAIGETLIPANELGPGAIEMKLVDRLLVFASRFPFGLTLLKVSCWCWEFSPLLSGKPARFSKLSLEERTAIFQAWESSRLFTRRWLFFLLKVVFMAAFYGNPEVWPQIGYEEGCLQDHPLAPGKKATSTTSG